MTCAAVRPARAWMAKTMKAGERSAPHNELSPSIVNVKLVRDGGLTALRAVTAIPSMRMYPT